jgi:hypothetical protein
MVGEIRDDLTWELLCLYRQKRPGRVLEMLRLLGGMKMLDAIALALLYNDLLVIC